MYTHNNLDESQRYFVAWKKLVQKISITYDFYDTLENIKLCERETNQYFPVVRVEGWV